MLWSLNGTRPGRDSWPNGGRRLTGWRGTQRHGRGTRGQPARAGCASRRRLGTLAGLGPWPDHRQSCEDLSVSFVIAMERLPSPSWRSAVHPVVRLFLSSVAPVERSTSRVVRSRVTSRAKMIGEICIQLFSRNIRGPQRQGGQNLIRAAGLPNDRMRRNRTRGYWSRPAETTGGLPRSTAYCRRAHRWRPSLRLTSLCDRRLPSGPMRRALRRRRGSDRVAAFWIAGAARRRGWRCLASPAAAARCLRRPPPRLRPCSLQSGC